MRHLDLSFEGKRLAERGQLDNGRLPHGGYRGSKKHPMSHLSYDKGREFHNKLQEELSRVMEYEEMVKHGGSPAWSILVHNSPSYTDESPLITNNLLAASKVEQINGTSLYNRQSLLPKKNPKLQKSAGYSYYRPNRMHQYLSATELKDSASEDVNMKYGRPTRTTLLRARQRSNSAPSNQVEKKQQKDLTQRLDDIKTAPASTVQNTEYLQLQSVRDGESLHSYLTGARYNRAHCLDSKSVEHNGVYMPRHNPALGSFFTGPKGQEYLQEFEESPRQDMPTPPSPPTPKRRPMTAPSYGRRTVYAPAPPAFRMDQVGSSKYKYLKLNIVGSRLSLYNSRDQVQPQPQNQHQQGLRLPKLQEAGNVSTDRRLDDALDQTYLVNQPLLPSPVGAGEPNPFSNSRHVQEQQHSTREHVAVGASVEYAQHVYSREDVDDFGVGGIRIEGRSTFKVKQMPIEEDIIEKNGDRDLVSVPAAVEEFDEVKEEEEKEDEVEILEEERLVNETIEIQEEVREENQTEEIENNVDEAETEKIEKQQDALDKTQEVEEDEIKDGETVLSKEEEETEEQPSEQTQEQEKHTEDATEDEVPDAEMELEPEHEDLEKDEVTDGEVDEIVTEAPTEDVADEQDDGSAEKNVLFFITEDGVGDAVAPRSGEENDEDGDRAQEGQCDVVDENGNDEET